MRNKELISKKIEQVSNALSAVHYFLSRGADVNTIKGHIDEIQEKLQEMQTLINTESDSWN